MRIGKCDDCGDVASLHNDDGEDLCPKCRFGRRHPGEAPLY